MFPVRLGLVRFCVIRLCQLLALSAPGRLDGPGGVLDFFTFPHFRPVILNPTTGEVVNNSPF